MLYENVEFTDDVIGDNALDKDKVITARRLVMQFFKKMGAPEKRGGVLAVPVTRLLSGSAHGCCLLPQGR